MNLSFIKSRNINTFLLTAAILLAAFIGFSPVKAAAPAGYPNASLGNCNNKEECRQMCSDAIGQHWVQCVYYFPDVDAAVLQKAVEALKAGAAAFARQGGPNGCSTDEECIGYCSNPANQPECQDYYIGPLWYWTNSNITQTAPLWIKKISAIITAMERNIEPPAECRNTYYNDHLSCQSQCGDSVDADGNPIERSEGCKKYLAETGFFSQDDFKLEAKLKELAKKGETGSCSGEDITAEEALRGCFDLTGFSALCAGAQDPVACFALADKYDLAPEKDIELGKKVAAFLKSGQTPGKCGNLRECQNYCSLQANYNECAEFADKLGLEVEPPEDPDADDILNAIKKGETPGGCKDEISCRAYCENLDHIQECLAFVEKFNLATSDELKEMRQLAAAKQAGVPFPGNCKTKQGCLKYCEAPSHAVECVAFAEAAGFISGDEAAQARKFAPLIARGETPGKCASKDQCEAYCEEGAHIGECLDFAIKYKLFPPEELEIMKKVQPFMKAGTMPGGCKSKDECEAYCENSDHAIECIDIGLALGVIKPGEVEIIKKSGGKGPGNCRSSEACEAFCSKPENQKECMDFAVKIGLMTQDEADQAQAAGDVRQCFEEADDKITSCFVTNLGVDLFEQMKAGKMPYDIEIIEKIRRAKACVKQYSDQATDVLGDFLKALPAADACVADEFGPDFIGRLRRMAIPCSQMKGIRGKMEACFLKGTNALFEPCAQKECGQVQGCMLEVSKPLMSIAQMVEAGDPAKSQKREFPKSMQDKLLSCGIDPNFDPNTCVNKSTCAEFFSCLNPRGEQQQGDQPGEMPPELKTRMDVCMKEIMDTKMRECTDKPTCGEVNACLKAQMSKGASEGDKDKGKKIELPPDVESRMMVCQQEEVQAKLDACLALSCSEFDACLKSLTQGDAGGGEQQKQSEPDPKMKAKVQACADEKINTCLAKSCDEFITCISSLGQGGGGGEKGQKQAPNPAIEAKIKSCQPKISPPDGGGGSAPPKRPQTPEEYKAPESSQYPQAPGGSSGEIPVTPELCANFTNVPACSYVGAPDSQNYQLCAKCYPDKTQQLPYKPSDKTQTLFGAIQNFLLGR
ncbi:MAG: hypothetical protein HYT67_00925 [Candidatus Yanofskybacteria bacterium]|nr:hypothetical protein [Candidatus Yanofskybacteria bacterium]